jgi:hypothetical protein
MRDIAEKKSRLKDRIRAGRKPSVQIVFPIIYFKNESLAAFLVHEHSGIYASIAKRACNAQHSSVSVTKGCVYHVA